MSMNEPFYLANTPGPIEDDDVSDALRASVAELNKLLRAGAGHYTVEADSEGNVTLTYVIDDRNSVSFSADNEAPVVKAVNALIDALRLPSFGERVLGKVMEVLNG